MLFPTLCPYCLEKVRFTREIQRTNVIYSCRSCINPKTKEPTQIPLFYVDTYRKKPPVVVSTIGFRGHGKTVYLASLFFLFKPDQLMRIWHKWGFYPRGVDPNSSTTMSNNVKALERGELPPPTPQIFLNPTMVQIKGVPTQRDSTLLFYDVPGESFEDEDKLVKYAHFVRRARTVLFLISIPGLKNPAGEMKELLDTYVRGMAKFYKGNTRNQHLVVVYTKGDEMENSLQNGYSDVWDYLTQGTVDKLDKPRGYMKQMQKISERLREFTRSELGGDVFISSGDFRSVTFSIVSALGAPPNAQNQMDHAVQPKRVLDPILWLMKKSQPGWKRIGL